MADCNRWYIVGSCVLLAMAIGTNGCSDDTESSDGSGGSGATSSGGSGGTAGASGQATGGAAGTSGTGGTSGAGGTGGAGGAAGASGSGGAAGTAGAAGASGSSGASGSGGGGTAAAGTYVLNGTSHTATTVSCAQIPYSYWALSAIETFSPRESFTVSFDAEPTPGTYDVIATSATYDPTATEAGVSIIVEGDVINQWFATGGGTLTVSDDGGKIHIEANDIPVIRQGTSGVGSINVTCD